MGQDESAERKNPRVPWGLVTFLVILAGLLLRLYHLMSRGLWLGEALDVVIALTKNFGEMLKLVIKEVYPPFYYVLLRFWVTVFGNTDLALRLLILLWGCLGIYGVYFLCRSGLDWSRRDSNLAALFAAILPMHAYYSQDVQPHIILFAFACFALGFLFRAHRQRKVRDFLLAGLFLGFMLYTNDSAIVYIIFLGLLYLLFLLLDRQAIIARIAGLLLSIATAVALYAPWLPSAIKQMKRPKIHGGFRYWVPIPNPGDYLAALRQQLGNWKLTLPFTVPEFLNLILLIPLLFLVAGGIFVAIKRRRTKELILAVVFLLYPGIFYVLSRSLFPMWLPRLFILSLIGVPILAALGTQMNFLKTRKALAAAAVIVFILVNVFTSLNLLATYQKEDWKSAGQFLSRTVGKRDAVLIYWGYYSAPLSRYLRPDIELKRIYIKRKSPTEDISGRFAKDVLNFSHGARTTFMVLASSDVPEQAFFPLIRDKLKLSRRISYTGMEILIFQNIQP
jgi:4-amino-4-deoxy-L-arabinose transferase-like glycosyltransferase